MASGVGVEFLAACDAEEAVTAPVTWAHRATLGALATHKLNGIASYQHLLASNERVARRNLVSFDYSFPIVAFTSRMIITFGITVREYLDRDWVEVTGIYLVILNTI